MLDQASCRILKNARVQKESLFCHQITRFEKWWKLALLGLGGITGNWGIISVN
jgi:hypothetical protein